MYEEDAFIIRSFLSVKEEEHFNWNDDNIVRKITIAERILNGKGVDDEGAWVEKSIEESLV